MKAENFTRLSIDVPERLHKVMKLYVVSNRLNIKNYVLNLIKNDLSEEMEDYLLGQMAMESAKEGFLGVKESEKFLKKLRKSVVEKPKKHTSKKSRNNEKNNSK
jgi:hypothetical protein